MTRTLGLGVEKGRVILEMTMIWTMTFIGWVRLCCFLLREDILKTEITMTKKSLEERVKFLEEFLLSFVQNTNHEIRSLWSAVVDLREDKKDAE